MQKTSVGRTGAGAQGPRGGKDNHVLLVLKEMKSSAPPPPPPPPPKQKKKKKTKVKKKNMLTSALASDVPAPAEAPSTR